MSKSTELILLCVGLSLSGITLATSGHMEIETNTVLTEDHSGSIAIAADHVTLDCAGFKFTQLQNGGTIQIFNRTGVTVKNCHNVGTGISSTLGIAIFNSNHIRIVDNTSTGFAPDTPAIKVFNSNKVSIVGNVVTSSRGMQLFGVSDSFIEGNTITSSDLGMDIISSHDKREGNRSC